MKKMCCNILIKNCFRLTVLCFFLLHLSVEVHAESKAEDLSPVHPPRTVRMPKTIRSMKAPVVGWSEKVLLLPEKLELEARITPGTSSSALYAKEIKKVTKKGKDSVQFSIEDRAGRSSVITRSIIDETITRTPQGTKNSRYRVQETFCLGNKVFAVEVLLLDAHTSEQEVRLGRDAIAGHLIVDPARSHTSVPDCLVKE